MSLERAGMNVYPVFSYRKRLAFLKEIAPDAVIYFAHGRMAMGQADAAVEWLRERNIPLFSPLSILQTRAEWEQDPMGMFGGFMSQSIVVPELDGAVCPYVVNDQEPDEEGVYLFRAIPERLRDFTQIVGNFVRLKRMPNAGKKVAIYYFKGAGQASLTAQGLETVAVALQPAPALEGRGLQGRAAARDGEGVRKTADDAGRRAEHLCRRGVRRLYEERPAGLGARPPNMNRGWNGRCRRNFTPMW